MSNEELNEATKEAAVSGFKAGLVLFGKPHAPGTKEAASGAPATSFTQDEVTKLASQYEGQLDKLFDRYDATHKALIGADA